MIFYIFKNILRKNYKKYKYRNFIFQFPIFIQDKLKYFIILIPKFIKYSYTNLFFKERIEIINT